MSLARVFQQTARKIHVVSDYLHAEWAAIRQFELLQESGNYKIFDMQSENIARTLRDLTGHMRGGGYRIIVATMGRYLKPENKDDLQILDERLQARIARLIHMMFLEEQSEFINHTMDVALIEERWDVYHVLPHLGVYLGARDLFSSHANIQQDLKETDRKHILSRIFLDIVNQLPTNHIVHDIAVGLQLPELINENEWIYLPEGVDKLYVFNNLMLDLFRCFDGISLSRLDGREDAGSEPKTTMSHMRSYGDRMTPENKQYYRKLLHFMM